MLLPPVCIISSSQKKQKELKERSFVISMKTLQLLMGSRGSRRGAKTERIEAAVRAFPGEFTLMELEKACAKVSHDMVRKVLRDLREVGTVECRGRGPGARWRKKDDTNPIVKADAQVEAIERKS